MRAPPKTTLLKPLELMLEHVFEHVGKLLESCLDHLMECFQMFSASPLVLNKLLPDAVDTNLLSFSAKT